MKHKENIMAILECHFAGFKEEIIESACNRILEQEPCEDVISREEAIDACNQSINILEATDRIKDLSPVAPQPKIGQWKRISIDKYVQHAMAYYRCSVCGKDIIGTHNYCPNCGAKMESEDK